MKKNLRLNNFNTVHFLSFNILHDITINIEVQFKFSSLDHLYYVGTVYRTGKGKIMSTLTAGLHGGVERDAGVA